MPAWYLSARAYSDDDQMAAVTMTEEQIIYSAFGVFFLFCAVTGFSLQRGRTALVGLIGLLIILLVASACDQNPLNSDLDGAKLTSAIPVLETPGTLSLLGSEQRSG